MSLKIITYNVKRKTVSFSDDDDFEFFEGENNAAKLVLDFTDAEVTSWSKHVHFIAGDGTAVNHDFAASTGVDTVEYLLPSTLMVEGTLQIQPEARDGAGAIRFFRTLTLRVSATLPGSGSEGIITPPAFTFQIDDLSDVYALAPNDQDILKFSAANQRWEAQPLGDATIATYVHEQMVALATWTITHNLGRYPSVTIVDSANDVVIGDITYLSDDQIRLKFNAAFSGKAYLN